MTNFYRETLPLNANTRAALPGQFIALADGVTHYEIAGPEDGQVIVLIHGFSTPMFLWNPTFGALVAAGFRVVRYDLFGRGYSDRPAGPYDADLFDRQLGGLLAGLGLDAVQVDLVGVSMGGVIAINFADRHPEQVRRLGLVDPAGFPMNVTLRALALFIPVLGELIMRVAGDRWLIGGLPHDFYLLHKLPAYVAQYRKQLPYKGFKRALLKTMREMDLTDAAEAYARVGAQGRRVLLIWGEHDATVPFESHERVLAAIPHAEFHPIPEAGHIPHYERPEVVNPIMIAFFRAEGST